MRHPGITHRVRRRRQAMSLLVLMGAAACGSTVPAGQAQPQVAGAVDALAGTGLEVPTGPEQGLPDVAAGAPPASVGAAPNSPDGPSPEQKDSGGTVRPGGAPAGPPTTTGRSAASVPATFGPGVTDTTIAIGFPYSPNSDQAQAALGNTAVTQGDPRAVAEALVAEINRTGGIAGRKLVAVFYEVDAQSGETQAQREQGVCAAFTEDNKVLAVVGATGPLLRDCLRKRGVLNVSGTTAALNEADFAANPNYYDAIGLTLDKAARNLVLQLSAQSYFRPWDTSAGRAGGEVPVKLGVVVPDKPSWVSVVNKVLLPALRDAGYPVAPENVRIWHFPESTAGNSEAVTEIQSIVLRFRSENVTHVLPMEQNSLVFFAPTAEGQGYRPRYGLSTAAFAQGYAGNLVPYRQLEGALGVGWLPAVDLPESRQTDAYSGPGRQRCLDIMARAQVSYDSANAKAIALLLCDAFFSFDASIDRLAGGSITATSFIPSLESLGDGFPTAGLPAGGYGPRRHYPVINGYPYGYSSSCECMQYNGGAFRLR